MLTTENILPELPEPRVKIAVKVIDQTGMEHMTASDEARRDMTNRTSGTN